MRGKSWVGLLVLLFVHSALARRRRRHGQSYTNEGEIFEAQRWPVHLDDVAELATLSIPGSYNPTLIGNDPTSCQTLPVIRQLDQGIRFFDVAVRSVEGLPIGTSTTLRHLIERDFVAHLITHPGDFILLSLRLDTNTYTDDKKPVEFVPELKRLVTEFKRYFFPLADTLPLVGEVRDSIVLIRNFEGDIGLSNGITVNNDVPVNSLFGTGARSIRSIPDLKINHMPHTPNNPGKAQEFHSQIKSGALGKQQKVSTGVVVMDFVDQAVAQHIVALNFGVNCGLEDIHGRDQDKTKRKEITNRASPVCGDRRVEQFQYPDQFVVTFEDNGRKDARVLQVTRIDANTWSLHFKVVCCDSSGVMLD